MENKKFKLTKNNLAIVQLIQHIVFINMSLYKQMRDRFNEESIRNNFELICSNYIRMNNPQSIICNSEVSNMQKIVKYILMGDVTSPEKHILIIDLEKKYSECLRIGLQISGRTIEPVSINIFNVQFEEV